MNGRTSTVWIAAFLLLQPLVSVEYARAGLVWPPCGDRHTESENYWGYDADSAYVFGLRIRNAVLRRDLDALFSLVDGELDRGPRRKFVENRSFDEIFPESWRREILDSEPGCEPFGWRGFLLANGLIRYHGDPFRITAIHGAVEEELPPVPTGWVVDGKLLSPECFAREWISGDNFEAFGEIAVRFGTGFDGSHPGRYLGDRFHPFDPIYSWGEIISPWRNPADCNTHPPERLSIENSAVRHTYDKERPSEYTEYRIMAEVSTERCHDLAPGLGGRCIESYLVEIFSPGGSMSFDWYYIYGLFQVGNERKVIFPLKRFDTLNLARNFLDGE